MHNRLGWLSIPFASALVAVACSGGSSGDDDNGVTLDGSTSDATIDKDGGGGGGGDGSTDSAAPFSPIDFGSRLVLWLDASQKITTADAGLDAAPGVGAWGDLSADHNDAHPFQGTAYLFSGATDAGINDLPVVRFLGNATLEIPQTTSLVWGTGDFTLYAVFRYHNATAAFALVAGKYDTVVPFPGPNLYANFFMPTVSPSIAGRLDSTHFVNAEIDGGYNDDKMRVAGMRRSGTHLEVRVDGVVTSTDDAGTPEGGAVDVSALDASFYVGGRPTGVGDLEGDVAEVIGVNGTLTDTEIGELESYLKAKYGL